MPDVVNKAGQFNVYKKSAAGQISLILPSFDEKGWLVRNGGIMIEATKAVGTDSEGNIQYDWSQKVSFSLGMNDLVSLFGDIESKLHHEYKGASKNLSFKPGTGQYEGTYQMLLSVKEADGSSRNVMVPLTAGEFAVLGRLMDRAIVRIIGW